MDALYAGVGGANAMRRRVVVATPAPAVTTAVAAAKSDVARPLPDVKAVAVSSAARFITFEEAGIRLPATENIAAAVNKSRFATFEEMGIAVPAAATASKARFATFEEMGIASTATASKPRFATFESLGMTPPLASRFSTIESDAFACKTCQMDGTLKHKHEHWCGKKHKKDKKHKKHATSDSENSDSDSASSSSAGDMKKTPVRTKETARRSDASPSSTLFDMDARKVIDARSVALMPPAAVTGEAYALSIKGIKRAVNVVRGKASSGGPAFVPFSKGEELGTQGLSADQTAMLVTVEASDRQVVGDKPLSVLGDRAIYEPILPVGARQKFQFRFAGKRLVPVKVLRAVHKYRIKDGKPLAGFKVVHVGGLGNVASKKKLLKKSKRKGSTKGASTVVYKGQPISLTFRNLRTGKDSTVTVDVPLEIADANSYPGSASVWYVPLDGASGPAMLVMLFERAQGLNARLSDLLFLYAPDVSIKANGTDVQLLASERYLATQIGALIDEVVISGYEGAQGNLDLETDELMVNADHASFSSVLHTLQSIVAAPGASDMAPRVADQLQTYVGALSACVHAHSATADNFDIPNPVELATGVPECVVSSDETSASGAEFAHTLAEVASDLAALNLDAHAVTIRASALYESVFGHLQCGVHLAGHLGDMDAVSDMNTPSANIESAEEAEAHISSLAVLTMAHIVGHMAVQSKMETPLNTFWNAASTATTDALNYEQLVATHFA